MTKLEQEARRLYREAAPVAPDWDQLGGATQGIWLERARLKAAGVADWWSITPGKVGKPTPAPKGVRRKTNT